MTHKVAETVNDVMPRLRSERLDAYIEAIEMQENEEQLAISLLKGLGYVLTAPLIGKCKLPECGKEIRVRVDGSPGRPPLDYCCKEHRDEFHKRTARLRMKRRRETQKAQAPKNLRSAGTVLLKIDEVARFIGFGRDTLYRMVRTGDFPAPIKISERLSRWKRSDLEAWLASRPRGTVVPEAFSGNRGNG